MTAGRPPLGPKLVDRLEGSDEAKEKFKIILANIAGEISVAKACEGLEISETRFYQLREDVLMAGAMSLEPKPRGRPKKENQTPESEVDQLRKENEELREELVFARARIVLTTAFPHLIKEPEAQKKTDPRKERRKKRKAQRQGKKKGKG